MKMVFPAAVLVVSTVSLAGCRGVEPAQPPQVQTIRARIVECRQEQVPQNLRSTGTIHARETAMISAQFVGRIPQILVREGDSVRAGQTLAVLEDSAVRASLNQAEAAVRSDQSQQAAAQADANLAASTLERYRQLEIQKSVSPQEMDEVTRRAQVAQARLDAARGQADAARAQESNVRAMLGYTRLLAPFAGVVTARLADPGTLASPGVPLLQVDQAGALQLQTTVDESAIGTVRKGMKVPVKADNGSLDEITGAVSEIVPAADPSSHAFLVKIDLPASSRLHAGMYATSEIAIGSRQAILIPRSAIVFRGSLPCAYVLDSQGIAQLRSVTLAAPEGDQVEVLSGISAKEKLIDAPADRDLSGKLIEVEP